MNINATPTPFGTVQFTASGPASKESQVKSLITRHAKALGLGQRTVRRSHVIGGTVTVFTSYRKA